MSVERVNRPRITTMLRAEIKSIESNDVGPDWKNWVPENSTDVIHWFTVSIGVVGENWSNLFQTAVATPFAGKGRSQMMRKFRGFVVSSYEPDAVEELFREYVSGVTGSEWNDIVGTLLEKMFWEYEGMAGSLKSKNSL